MVRLSMTSNDLLSDLWHGFQGHDIFWSRISWKRCVLKTKFLLHKRIPNSPNMFGAWSWLTSKCVARVCQQQLSFLFIMYLSDLGIFAVGLMEKSLVQWRSFYSTFSRSKKVLKFPVLNAWIPLRCSLRSTLCNTRSKNVENINIIF